MEYKEDVYRKVCDSEWIGSLCEDLRSSVFDILHELFGEKEHSNAEQCRTFQQIIVTRFKKFNPCNSVIMKGHSDRTRVVGLVDCGITIINRR